MVYKNYILQGIQNRGTMKYQCTNLITRQWRHLMTSKKQKHQAKSRVRPQHLLHMVCTAKHREREFKDIPLAELDRLFGHFFVCNSAQEEWLSMIQTQSSLNTALIVTPSNISTRHTALSITPRLPQKLKTSEKFLKGNKHESERRRMLFKPRMLATLDRPERIDR